MIQVIAEGISLAQNIYSTVNVSVKKDVVSSAIATAYATAYVKLTQDEVGDSFAYQKGVSDALAKPMAKLVFEVLALAFGGKFCEHQWLCGMLFLCSITCC